VRIRGRGQEEVRVCCSEIRRRKDKGWCNRLLGCVYWPDLACQLKQGSKGFWGAGAYTVQGLSKMEGGLTESADSNEDF